ncbi:MAG: MBL fold metallo-hydrolase [Chitinophagaceae bacterium]
MSLYISSLNSGSNGNCYYVGNGNEAVLIDAGLSCRETEKRMERLNLSMNKVKGIFISHEHADHIRGISGLASKYNLPVYATQKTWKRCSFRLPQNLVIYLQPTITVCIGELCITSFLKIHDASDPQSFTISYNGTKVGVFTDIGAPCANLSYYFNQCHAAFLEANYDEVLLEKGRYPIHLKNRIRGGKGHLSNSEALSFYKIHKPAFMKYLILAHLSSENNCPELVQQLFVPHAGGAEVIVASRYKETPIFTVKGEQKLSCLSPSFTTPQSLQMSLF